MTLPADFTLLQVVPELDTGGAEQTTIDVAHAVVRAGGKALVATRGGRMAARLLADGGRLAEMPVQTKNPLVMLGNAARLVNLIRAEKVSIVHARSRAPAFSALWAAQATSTEPLLLEEIIVTARRREESAQDVPIAITALSGDALNNQHIENVQDLTTIVPTLTISQSSGRENSPVYSLRGVRPTESLYGQDPTVAIYMADVVLSPAGGTNLGLYDLGSIQVLKGPQGTLFGRNTTGGAILMSPRRPGSSYGSDIMVGYGSFGLAETRVGLDLPLADTFAVRLAGRTVDSDGYQTNVSAGPLQGSKLGGSDTRSARLSAVWNPSDSLENYTVLSWDERTTNGRGTTLLAANPGNSNVRCYDGPGNPNSGGALCPGETSALPSVFDAVERARDRSVRDVESDMRQYEKLKAKSVINTTTLTINESLTAKGIGGYRDFESEQAIDLDSTDIPGMLTGDGDEKLHVASYELQLLGDAWDHRLDWVTGLYWYHETGYQQNPGRTLQGINPSNPFTQFASVDNDSYSAFAQASFSITEALSFTAGIRANEDRKRMVIKTFTPASCSLFVDDGSGTGATVRLPQDQCAVSLSDSFSQTTGNLSLDYKLDTHSLIYVASRLGYRAGGFNLRGTEPTSYKPFDPETVKDVEVGTKTDWSLGSWNMRTNADIYHQWYDDIQRTVGVTNATGVPGSAVQNAAKAKVLGIEIEQTIAPTDHWTLQLNYAYTDPKYVNWTEVGADRDANGNFPTVDLSDTPFHFTPKHAGSATLSFTTPVHNKGTLLMSATGSYRSHVWINSLQTIRAIERTPDDVKPHLQQDGYWLLDLSASWLSIMGTSLDVAAYARNVTDEEYAVGGIQLYASAYESIRPFGISTKAYGEPRTFGMQLTYHF